MLSLKVQALFWYKGGRKGSMVPSKMSIDWKDRATESERKLALLREVLLDVDALLNLGKRQADVVFARLRREDDPITKRIEDALLETDREARNQDVMTPRPRLSPHETGPLPAIHARPVAPAQGGIPLVHQD